MLLALTICVKSGRLVRFWANCKPNLGFVAGVPTSLTQDQEKYKACMNACDLSMADVHYLCIAVHAAEHKHPTMILSYCRGKPMSSLKDVHYNLLVCRKISCCVAL